uniref:MSP domain-containing protein n=1 Tax=Panagrellus redivivus TaxID=6233 RepID=A0A7E4WCW3_PANRE
MKNCGTQVLSKCCVMDSPRDDGQVTLGSAAMRLKLDFGFLRPQYCQNAPKKVILLAKSRKFVYVPNHDITI